ncbi:MAG: CsgG/HfaB family protein [Pseudomonadota bacterium]
MTIITRSFAIVGTLIALVSCATPGFRPEMRLADAELNPVTVTEHTLKWLPGPQAPIPVAVYGLADETGAFQPSSAGQNLSRAVTQGPTPILIKALQDAGNRRWFSVIERENLQNLLRERQIILDMRKRYLGEEQLNREALPALKFAGVLIEGAITGFDTNTITGGAGARYLGIGGNTEYREDAVSVYLRAVSVKTGEVLISISSEQRIASVAVQGNAFRFVSFQELLEAEAGITMNQPRHLAVRQALEKAVYGMVVEGAELGLWAFNDDAAGAAAINHYRTAYAPAFNDRFNESLPYEFFAAAGNVRRQNRILRETMERQEAERLAAAAATGQQDLAALNDQTTQVADAAALPSQRAAEPTVLASASVQRQQVARAQPTQPTPVASPQRQPAAQQASASNNASPAPLNRALADALAAIASTEGVAKNSQGQMAITQDTAESLANLRDGRTPAGNAPVQAISPP